VVVPEIVGKLKDGATLETGAAVPVALKVTGDPVKPMVTVTVLEPALVPKVQEVRVAIPELLVVAAPPTIDPAPLAKTKVTETPETALLLASLTITDGALLTAVPAVADWVITLLAAI
jgi:hypothetical protein